ncbi:MAG: hypothetical protein JO132_17980 [Streptosporangiaceae bacterium]|nr:hypothetical protein [Streptosporangiaceae bacterium]
MLRYRAATVRADRARALLGDAVRSSQAGMDNKQAVARTAGISREFLYRVLAGQEWTWPRGRQVRPPGSRRPHTPVRELAAWTVDDSRYCLVSYRDTQGGACVAVDRGGEPGIPLCDVKVSDRHPVGAGMTMATMGHGTAVVYGRVHDRVTGIYTVMNNGERADWPICADPENGQRYFAVIADSGSLADIVATGKARNTSLADRFAIWFRRAP